MLKNKDMQRWYSLSFEKGEVPAICIAIYEECIDELSKLLESRHYAHIIALWKFSQYEHDLRNSFGCDKAVQITGAAGEYWMVRIPLSHANNPDAAAVSIKILLGALNLLPTVWEVIYKTPMPTDPNHLQFISIESTIAIEKRFNSAALGGYISPLFTEWLEYQSEKRRHLEDPGEAMRLARNSLVSGQTPWTQSHSPNFSCRLGPNGSFTLQSLDGSTFTNEWDDRPPQQGHDLDSHNIDGPVTQLCLLAGLAAMHDLASKDLDLQPPA